MSAPTLSILVYNTHRRHLVCDLLSNHHLLHTLDILLLQEPPLGLAAPPDWVLLPAPPGGVARSVALVRKKWAASTYAQVAVASHDVVALDLRAGGQSVRVIGVYNPHQGDRQNAGRSAREILPPLLESTPSDSLVVVAGDFNLHHPDWDPGYHYADGVCSDAEEAQLTFARFGLAHLLPSASLTFRPKGHAPGAIDLVLGNLRVEERVVSCAIDDEFHCLSDHMPIRLVLAIAPPPPAHQKRHLLRKMDPAKLRKAIASALGEAPPPALETRNDVDKEAERLTEALKAGIATIPLSRPPREGRRAHAWWTQEISELRRVAAKKARQAYRQRGRPGEAAAKAAARAAQNKLKGVIRREKRRVEREEMAQVDEKSLWAAVKKAAGGRASATTPPLKKDDGTYATSPQDKLDLLRPVLLPVVEPATAECRTVEDEETQVSPPSSACISMPVDRTHKTNDRHAREHAPSSPADPSISTSEVDDAPELPWPTLHEHEVKSALFAARPYAAVGPDNVPNVVLQTAWDILAPHLVPLYAASLALGHLPRSWRDCTGVVLRKPKKPDYSEKKAYRLIAFERCVAKVLEAVVARRLSHLGERGLWPVEHVGGRKGRSAEDAVVCFVDEIKRQQRHGNIVVGVALDVAKAFPSVRADVLDADLRKGGVPAAARRFIMSFMSGRTCKLVLEGVSTDALEWRSGLPQGSPLSPALFLTYNSALLRACRSASTMATGWIDDINLLGWGKSVSEAVNSINSRVPELEEWSRTHASAFEPTKTTAVVFRTRRTVVGAAPPVVLCGVEVEWADELVMLGTRLDAGLSFDAHVRACATRAAQAIGGLGVLARANTGVRPAAARQLVRACVYPRMLWMAGVWWKGRGNGGSALILNAVQRTCARLVTGGYGPSGLDALQVEASLMPVELLLDGALFSIGLRALSAAPTHPLYARVGLARAHLPKRQEHRSPLHRALHQFPNTLPTTLRVEALLPEPVAPWEADPLPPAAIAESKEKARETHLALLDDLEPGDIVAYSDGSLMGGQAGAGWAMRAEVEGGVGWMEKSGALGGQHTVYVAELEGMRMVLSACSGLQPLPYPSTLHLCLDNQAAVRHPTSPRPNSGQHSRLAIRALVEEMRNTHPLMAIRVSWVPGHADVEGNERADARAKAGAEAEEVAAARPRGGAGGKARRSVVMPREAIEQSVEPPSDDEDREWWGGEEETSLQARANQPPPRPLPRLALASDQLEDLRRQPKSVSALKQEFRAVQMSRWEASWRSLSAGAGLRLVVTAPPGRAFSSYHSSLSRRHSTLLARLRLNFSGLNDDLRRIGKHPTGACECGALENRRHFLLDCRLLARPRAQLLREIGKRSLPPLATLLSDPNLARPLLRFVNASGRFPRLHEVVKDAPGKGGGDKARVQGA